MRVIRVRGNRPTQLGGGGAAFPLSGAWRMASVCRPDNGPRAQRRAVVSHRTFLGYFGVVQGKRGTSDVGTGSCGDLDRAAYGLRDDALGRAHPRSGLRAVLRLRVGDEVATRRQVVVKVSPAKRHLSARIGDRTTGDSS